MTKQLKSNSFSVRRQASLSRFETETSDVPVKLLEENRYGIWYIICTGLKVLTVPVKAVHHFELSTQLFLGEVVQHAGVHQRLHEVAPVLRQTQTRQPVIPNPLVVHITISQNLTHTHT